MRFYVSFARNYSFQTLLAIEATVSNQSFGDRHLFLGGQYHKWKHIMIWSIHGAVNITQQSHSEVISLIYL